MFATSPRVRGLRTLWVGIAAGVVVWGGAGRVGLDQAQAQSNYQYDSFRNDPFLALMPRGHYSEVKSIIFTPDGSQILSGGMDKMVHVWNLRPGELPWNRTLRPPQWRGLAGSVFAMAISPRADASGQRLLAVAGQGVQSTGGNIVLFRFPGLRDAKTGDLVGHLISSGGGAARTGHDSSVYGLSFHPAGDRLASASGDQTVIIWDTATLKPVATLRGHTAPVRAVSYLPNGQQLLSAGEDGVVRLWSAAGAQVGVSAAPPANANALDRQFMCLAVSPRGDFAIAGRRDGKIVRFALPNLTETVLNPQDRRGDVFAVALSPDARTLAVCGLRDRMATAAERPVLASTLEIWSLAPGQAATRRATKALGGWLLACAFSPDGQRVAYGGSDYNAVYYQNVADVNRDPFGLLAGGKPVRDVGFTADGSKIAYSSAWPEEAGVRQGFHLTAKENRFSDVAAADVQRLAKTGPLGSITPLSQHRFRIAPAGGQTREIELDPAKDGRWWSYGIIPPAPSHPVALAAIACEGGVKIHRMDTGGLTRYYAGHAGSVYAVSASPDGRWLITGSTDQTVRLWSLQDAHRLPPLGATFQRRADGEQIVASVTKYSFADLMGMKVGDRIIWSAIGRQFYVRQSFSNEPVKTFEQFLQDAPMVRPNAVQIQFMVSRADKDAKGNPIQKELGFPTTKRDAPAANFYATANQDWLIWMQQGFYDTSIQGDDNLGWHVNRGWVEDAPRPTDAFGIREYEARFLKPDVIRALLRTGSVPQALAAAAPPPAPNPPRVELAGATRNELAPKPGQAAAQVTIEAVPAQRPLTVALSEGQTIVGALQAQVFHDTELVFQGPMPANLGAARELTRWTPQPGRHVLSLVITDGQGGIRRQAYSYDGLAAKPQPPKPARLILLTAGEGKFAALPEIPQARDDLREIARFFKSGASDAAGTKLKSQDALAIVAKDEASAIREALSRLKAEAKKGDTVLAAFESHQLTTDADGRGLIAVADTAPPSYETAVSTREVSDVLGELAKLGCRVFIVLDCVHETKPAEGAISDIWSWARELRSRNVTVIAASKNGPGEVEDGRGAFAVGLTKATGPEGPKLDEIPEGKPFNLYQFERAATGFVESRTNRRQHLLFALPPTVDPVQSFVFP